MPDKRVIFSGVGLLAGRVGREVMIKVQIPENVKHDGLTEATLYHVEVSGEVETKPLSVADAKTKLKPEQQEIPGAKAA